MTVPRFREQVWSYYAANGRHTLPWRATTNPYHILVSEVMLQQTQVDRVIPFYRNFIKKFPTVRKLAQAPLSEVLTAWQGLGYNRRAKKLHDIAKAVTKRGKIFPSTVSELLLLPGVGPYTAHAVTTFAYNQDAVFIETNIRTAVLHHFFEDRADVSDEEIAKILEKALPKGKARAWYSALMDYGAHLKHSGVRLNAKSKGYTKQKTFAGSDRQARGAILRELVKGRATKTRLVGLLGDDRKVQLEAQLQKLLREEMIKKQGISYVLP